MAKLCIVDRLKGTCAKNCIMRSKRGIIITIVILAGITAASFLAWIPIGGQSSNNATFIITDHKAYLDDVNSIHEVLMESTAIEFEMLVKDDITPEQYIIKSDIASSQVTMQIKEFIASKPPEMWQESYILYGEALRSFNSYLAETQVVANMIQNRGEITDEQMQEALDRADKFSEESKEYIIRSDAARPSQ